MDVRHGNARFQILTDRLIRMEWAEDGVFEDHPSLSVINRNLSPVDFRHTIENETLTIKTKSLKLEYTNDGKPFSKSNLKITFYDDDKEITWHPGLKDTKNLKGTSRTLDGAQGWSTQLDDGFISRNGWAFYDDSQTPVLYVNSSGELWPDARPEGVRQDLYFWGYGNDYKSALKNASLIFGRQPIPPRWSLGYWWSRYWAYTDRELEELINEFNMMKIPIDVLVVDMDWHLEGWTGYTWDRRYFPNPQEFLARMKSLGLKVTLNLHPAQGVGKHEEKFVEMTKSMGIDPDSVDGIPFDCTNQKYMESYFKILHHPLEDMGVDFWWMDWQQGTETSIKGLDPLQWLNYLHWRDFEKRRKSKRPIILSRYGGPGSGRFPIGFSGDTHSTWESLSFQPYFTSTSANALFGFWSHDIGGHLMGEIEPELYLRWIQFGVFSPVLRTHTTKNPKAERRVWKYPDPFSKLMIDAIKLRYEMVPYIYTEMRKCFDSGVSLCRPMYYAYPDDEKAYKVQNQYMFGDEMLVAPVVMKSDSENEMGEVEVWLPDRDWFDSATGEFLHGGKTLKRNYLASEIPVFVKPGTIIPGQQVSMRLEEGSYRDLLITVYPGDEGKYLLYEDDGITTDYENGKFVSIPISHKLTGSTRRITIGKATGIYRDFIRRRSLEIRLPGSVPPKEIVFGDKSLRWAYRIEKIGWTYDGDTATTIIRIQYFDVIEGLTMEIRNDSSIPPELAYGLKGLMSRLNRVAYYSTLATEFKVKHPEERLPIEASQTGNRISRNPLTFKAEIENLKRVMSSMPKMMKEFRENIEHKDKRDYLDKAKNIFNLTKKQFYLSY